MLVEYLIDCASVRSSIQQQYSSIRRNNEDCILAPQVYNLPVYSLLFAPLSKLILSSCPPENALSKVEGGTPGFIKTETGIARFYLRVIEKLYDEKKYRANFNIVGYYSSGRQGLSASGVCICNKNLLRCVNRVFRAKSIDRQTRGTCTR